MPRLDELGLNEQSAPEFDWDAPEAGRVPPAVYPGLYTLRFRLPENTEDWFDGVEREVIKRNPASKRKFLELTYEPEVVADSQGRPLAAEDGSRVHVGP